MSGHTCSCAKCRGFSPWRERFAQCIRQGWINADIAVADGIAVSVRDRGERTVQDAIREMREFHRRWGWE